MNQLGLFVQLLVILGLALFCGALIAGHSPQSITTQSRTLLHPLLERQRDRAATLGWTLRWWLTVRLLAGLGGGSIAMLIGSPVVLVGGLALGLLGVPWYLNALAGRRRLHAERALVMVVRNLVELIANSNQTLEHALVDVATNPDPVLASALRPLLDTEQSVRTRLVQVADRFRSPIAGRLCADLLLSMESTPAAFVEQAREVLVPQLEEDLKLQERDHAAMVGGRTSSLIVAGLMLVTLLVVMRVDSLRAIYETAAGQLVLILIWASVLGIIWTIGWITPRAPALRWDLDALKSQLERRYA